MAIPRELNEKLDRDPFYEKCAMTGERPVQRHHNFIYGHRAVQEAWCILPLVKRIHDIEKRRDIKERLDWIMLNRADYDTLRAYSKVDDLYLKLELLNQKFGVWTPDWYARRSA